MSSSGPAAPARPQVIVDGKNLNVTGGVTCTPNGNNINIGIGIAANGFGAVVSNGNPARHCTDRRPYWPAGWVLRPRPWCSAATAAATVRLE